MAKSKIKSSKLSTIEDKIFRSLLIADNKNYQDFRNIYMDSKREFRPVYPRDENGKPIYDSGEDTKLEAVDVPYITFKEWFVRRGIKLRRILMFLDLLDYRMVIVPKNAKVTISCETEHGERMYGASAPKAQETVQLFALSSQTGEVTIDEATPDDEPLMVRTARKDKPDRNNTRFPNVQKSMANKAKQEAGEEDTSEEIHE